MATQEPPRDTKENEWAEELPRRPQTVRRSSGRSGMWNNLSRRSRERLILIGINAALSLIISLVVVAVWDAVKSSPAPTPEPVAEVTAMPTATTTPPAATPTPGPGEPVTYRVQPGDTLLSIATQFDITVEEIMTANNLEDANFIQIGQELLIPIGGLPEATATFTPEPLPTDTPGPTPTAQPPTPIPTYIPTALPVTPPSTEPQVVIREILDAGVLANEAVFVFNSGRSVLMDGWTLSDAQDNVYTFPNLFLGTGGSVRIHTNAGSNSATDLYWGLDAPVWGEPGDVATLRDESGLEISTFELP